MGHLSSYQIFFLINKINRSNAHGKVWMAPPLREPLSHRSWRTETSYAQFWRLDQMPSVRLCRDGNWLQHGSSIPDVASPLGSRSLPKETLLRAAVPVPKLVTVETQWLPLLVASAMCNACFHHKEQQRQRQPTAHRLRRGAGQTGPRDHHSVCLLLSQTGLGAGPGPG